MTVVMIQEGSPHMGCTNHCVGCACVVGSCKVAATGCLQVPSIHMSSGGLARATPHGPSFGAVLSLEAEPTFLAHISNATWHDADLEMRKFACYARGPYALFHVKQLHGYDIVFQSSGELARLVVPAICM